MEFNCTAILFKYNCNVFDPSSAWEPGVLACLGLFVESLAPDFWREKVEFYKCYEFFFLVKKRLMPVFFCVVTLSVI